MSSLGLWARQPGSTGLRPWGTVENDEDSILLVLRWLLVCGGGVKLYTREEMAEGAKTAWWNREEG